MLGMVANLVVNQNAVESVFLGEIDYQKAKPYFLLAFRNKDGSTTAAYVEREDIESVHTALQKHLVVNTWTKVDTFGFLPPRLFAGN